MLVKYSGSICLYLYRDIISIFSSLQSHRSRVFQRRQSALPNIRDADPFNRQPHHAAAAGKHAG